MRRGTRLALLTALLVGLVGAGKRPPGLGDVEEIRVFEHPDHTRIVVELSRPASYKTGFVGNPPRFYVDIEGIWIEPPMREHRPMDDITALQSVRGGQNTLTRARVVMELDRASREHETFHLSKPFRIVTDIDTAAGSSSSPGQSGPLPRVSTSPGPHRGFDSRPLRRVVIDPGHGGKDPGARGSRKLVEKDLVLRISHELRKILKDGGLEVLLTRDRDVYLTLGERTQRANLWHGDLFVSIHANAAPNRKSHGVETYLLDTSYSRQTARVAARENGTTVDRLSAVQQILASLRLGYSERYAARAAQKVQLSLLRSLNRKFGRTQDLGVKRGPFLVLFEANMPAVLVEVGFLTNRAEAKRMRSRDFPRVTAQGIAGGILAYRDEHARRLVAGR